MSCDERSPKFVVRWILRETKASTPGFRLHNTMGVGRKRGGRGAGEEREYAEGRGGRLNWRVRV